MHPYRERPRPGATSVPAEERILYALLAAGGALRLAIGVALAERFGAELTIAAILLVLGVFGLIRTS